jgi:hypothetical protein
MPDDLPDRIDAIPPWPSPVASSPGCIRKPQLSESAPDRSRSNGNSSRPFLEQRREVFAERVFSACLDGSLTFFQEPELKPIFMALQGARKISASFFSSIRARALFFAN